MSSRCDIFFNYTLPMLEIAATDRLFRHVVSYSEVLPMKFQTLLVEAAARYSFVLLDKVPAGGGPFDMSESEQRIGQLALRILEAEGLDQTAVFGLMRLDDDDVLSADYFDQMAPYITSANTGFVVSLSRGVTALYEDGEFYHARETLFPLHSKGHLSICRFDSEGRFLAPVPAPHNKADRYNPVILDGRKISHLWVRSISQDTALYQLQQGPDGMLARIYTGMDEYPALKVSVDDLFPVLSGKIHEAKPRVQPQNP